MSLNVQSVFLLGNSCFQEFYCSVRYRQLQVPSWPFETNSSILKIIIRMLPKFFLSLLALSDRSQGGSKKVLPKMTDSGIGWVYREYHPYIYVAVAEEVYFLQILKHNSQIQLKMQKTGYMLKLTASFGSKQPGSYFLYFHPIDTHQGASEPLQIRKSSLLS